MPVFFHTLPQDQKGLNGSQSPLSTHRYSSATSHIPSTASGFNRRLIFMSVLVFALLVSLLCSSARVRNTRRTLQRSIRSNCNAATATLPRNKQPHFRKIPTGPDIIPTRAPHPRITVPNPEYCDVPRITFYYDPMLGENVCLPAYEPPNAPPTYTPDHTGRPRTHYPTACVPTRTITVLSANSSGIGFNDRHATGRRDQEAVPYSRSGVSDSSLSPLQLDISNL